MGLKNTIQLFIIILFIGTNAFADYDLRVDLSNQSRIYSEEITKLEETIKFNGTQIYILENSLKNISDNIRILNALINYLDSGKTADIREQFHYINILEKTEKLKLLLREIVISLYKYGRLSDFEYIFQSDNLNEKSIKIKYLKQISDVNLLTAGEMKSSDLLISEREKYISLASSQRSIYLQQKKTEYSLLNREKTGIAKKIDSIRSDNEGFGRQIQNRKDNISKIDDLLNSISNNYIYKTHTTPDYTSESIRELKGRLILPVNSIFIISDFGKYTNTDTKVVTYNNGLDFSIAKGSDVRCTASGIAEDAEYYPFYGNTVIINHGNNIRTVYSVITNLKIKKGDRIKAGDIIGSTHENSNGQCFHFEIWDGNNPQNPYEWLKF